MNSSSGSSPRLPSRPAGPSALEIGHTAESGAAEFLKKQGYRILHLNWRCRRGEIDIVAEEGRTIVFVEVKLRGQSSHGTPAEAVTLRKQTRIVLAATLYAVQHSLQDRALRFDVVEALEDPGSGSITFRLWRDAFTPSGSYQPF